MPTWDNEHFPDVFKHYPKLEGGADVQFMVVPENDGDHLYLHIYRDNYGCRDWAYRFTHIYLKGEYVGMSTCERYDMHPLLKKIEDKFRADRKKLPAGRYTGKLIRNEWDDPVEDE